MQLNEAYQLYITQEIRLKGGADKTARNYQTSCNSLLAAIGDIPVTLLTLDHVGRWLDYMSQFGLQPTSRKTNLCTLRQVLRYLKKRQVNVLDYRDIELPSTPQRPHTVLDYSEVQALIDATDNLRDKAIIACLHSTGCRVSELLNLNRDDIVNGEAVVTGKFSKQRPVFFDETAMKRLEMYLETRKDKIPALFISGQYRRITVSRVEQILHVLTAHAGLEKVVTPHVFRHSAITDYISNGAPMGIVQRLAGHASITTTLNIYTHVSDNTLRETAKNYRMKKTSPVATNSSPLTETILP